MMSTSESALMEDIKTAFDLEHWQIVVSLADELAPESANFLEARQLAAVAAYYSGKLEVAISLLKEVVDDSHHNPNIYLNYANFLGLSGSHDEAVNYYQKALLLNPNLDAAHNNLGSILFDLKRLPEAQVHLKKAIELNPDYWEANSHLANIYFQNGEYQQAIEFYRKALQLNAGDFLLLNNLGLAYLAAGLLESAVNVFQAALKIKPNTAEVFIPLSAILETLGKTEMAHQILSQGIENTPWYLSGENSNNKIPVISFAGFQNSKYDIDDHNKVKIDGGHFYSKYLIDEKKIARYRYHIVNRNIETDKTLPDCQLYINTISDPDLEAKSLASLSRFMQSANEINIINHPDKIMQTTRDGNYNRLHHLDGLTFPKTIRLQVNSGASQNKLIEKEFDYPFLIRRVGTQTGTSFVKIKNHQQLSLSLKKLDGQEVYLIEYINTSFRNAQNEKLFRRFRFFFIDNKMFPVTCHIHNSWNVHSIDRNQIMQQQNELTDIESKFLENPAEIIGEYNVASLRKLVDIVKLDFFGVDFSITQSGELVVFEVNAAMNHSYNYAQTYPYLVPFLDNISDAFHTMLKNKAKQLNNND